MNRVAEDIVVWKSIILGSFSRHPSLYRIAVPQPSELNVIFFHGSFLKIQSQHASPEGLMG